MSLPILSGILKMSKSMAQCVVNLFLMNGFSHLYHLGESTFIFRDIRSDFLNFIQFFDEYSPSKMLTV